MSDRKDYAIKAKSNYRVTIDPVELCPYYTMDIQVRVKLPAQIDGHAWPNVEVDGMTDQMIKDITDETSEQITEFVRNVEPYRDYGKYDRPRKMPGIGNKH
jgi:hypothetical protein